MVPFVTEALWRALVGADGGDGSGDGDGDGEGPDAGDGDGRTLALVAWPTPAPHRRDADAEAGFAALQEAVTVLRRFRADHGLAPTARLTVRCVAAPDRRGPLKAGLDGIRRLAGVDEWAFAGPGLGGAGAGGEAGGDVGDVGPVGKVVLGGAASGVELYVPLSGLIDVDEERARLRRELANAEAELARARGKLANERFVERARPDVVQAERDKAARWDGVRDTLRAQLDDLS